MYPKSPSLSISGVFMNQIHFSMNLCLKTEKEVHKIAFHMVGYMQPAVCGAAAQCNTPKKAIKSLVAACLWLHQSRLITVIKNKHPSFQRWYKCLELHYEMYGYFHGVLRQWHSREDLIEAMRSKYNAFHITGFIIDFNSII